MKKKNKTWDISRFSISDRFFPLLKKNFEIILENVYFVIFLREAKSACRVTPNFSFKHEEKSQKIYPAARERQKGLWIFGKVLEKKINSCAYQISVRNIIPSPSTKNDKSAWTIFH